MAEKQEDVKMIQSALCGGVAKRQSSLRSIGNSVSRQLTESDVSTESLGLAAATSRVGALHATSSRPEPCRPRWPADGDDDEDQMRASDVETHFSIEDEPSQVHLSIFWSGGKLGAAYYDSASCQIHVLNDTVDVAPEFIILTKVIRYCQPAVIVTSAHQDERLLAILRDAASRSREELTSERSTTSETVTDEDDGAASRSTALELRLEPTVDFDAGGARARIVNINLPGIPASMTDSDKLIFMSSLVNFDNISMVRAFGALLKYLDRKRINVEMEDYAIKSPVISISIFSVKDLVSVDEDTYRALQIFRKESHPSVYKMASGMKEGLSLFGIFNRTKSTIGSKEMKLWFQRPTREADVLRGRQMAIAFGSQTSNADVVASLQGHLKHIRDVSRILDAMSIGQCTMTEWVTLYKSIYNAAQIGEICASLPQTIYIFQKISIAFTQELLDIAALISRIVDFDESHSQNRFVVKYGVDEQLDQRLPDFMTTIAGEELVHLDATVEECEVIYLPQLGYLLAIKMSPLMEQTQDYERPDLDFVFAIRSTVYYKSFKTKELDKQLGDIQNVISDQEINVMLQLQNTILQHRAVLADVSKYAAQLDCLLAMAEVAKDSNYVRPQMTDEDVIHIENGRHPLQELCVPAFVQNTTTSGVGLNNKIKLLTGPNACGKSVYLKQVALIVFMAHIGSFVPATSATIGQVDAIFTRIHTLESVSVGLSTFMIDLNQVSLAIRLATKHSLVIIDEFGKGTSAVDGMALLAACLKFWALNPETCPHLFVATHIYGVLKILSEWIGNVITCQTLETACGKDELVFLYQLVEGQASCSYAHWVAKQANMPRRIVDRGLQITEAVCESRPIPAADEQQLIYVDRTHARFKKIVNDFLTVDLTTEDEAIQYLARSRNAEQPDVDVVISNDVVEAVTASDNNIHTSVVESALNLQADPHIPVCLEQLRLM